jgi:hypothetical protein
MSDVINPGTGEIGGFSHRWSNPANEIFAAVAKAQTTIKNAVKDSANPHFKSKYADLASVREACWESLTSAGIAVIQMPINEGGNVGVVTLFAHSSGQWIEGTVYVAPTRYDAQGVGSVITYLRRYALAAMAGVAPDDDDGEAAVGRPAERAAPTAGNGAGAGRAYNRPQAAPPPTAAAAEIKKRWDEIRADIDIEEDAARLDIDQWSAFQTLADLSAKLGPDSVHATRMQLLRDRAMKRREKLIGSLEPFDGR